MNKFLIINCSKKVLKHYVMIKDLQLLSLFFKIHILFNIIFFPFNNTCKKSSSPSRHTKNKLFQDF